MKSSWKRYGYPPSPRRRPYWWPEDEAWPPRGMRPWRRHRPAFFWRAGGFFLFMVFIPVATCIGTLWLLGLLGDPSSVVSTAAFAVLIGFAAALLLTAFGALRRMVLPLGDLIGAAGQVEAGDFSARVHPSGPRELRSLGRAFNKMAERLELTETQRRHLVADLSHELRTPVSVIQGNLEGMLDGIYEPDEAHLGPVLEEVRLLSRLIEDLRTLSEAESGTLELHREPTDLGVLASDIAASFRPQAESEGVELAVEVPAEVPLIEVDPVRIREVLVNLTTNALRHTPKGGRITIGADVNAVATLTVSDTGSGITAEDLPKVFDRFYKSEVSSGRGLGLTIAKNLVAAHGGEISAESTPGEGTTVRFTLPIESQP